VLVLDTDHLSHFDEATPAGERLRERLLTTNEEPVATIISAEEQLRGWLAQIHQTHADPIAAVPIYGRLERRLEFYARWTVLPWDNGSAHLFVKLHAEGVRIGSMDLKIACITITNGGKLLTRNTRDFIRVPGLHIENWLD
jgi:tRNA(fMet)-specific endonuclease VapC